MGCSNTPAPQSTQGTPVTPPARFGAAMGFDPVHNVVVMFGGGAADPQKPLDDTWLWNGSAWAQAHPAHRPEATGFGFQMAFDSARGVLVLLDDSGTYTWDGHDWTKHLGGGTGVGEGGVAYDPSRRVVMTQGNDGTWAWDGTTWSLFARAAAPLARSQGPIAWDVANSSMVLFGGGPGGWGVTSPYTGTWVLPQSESTWSVAHPTSEPHARYLNILFYSARLHRVINYGGLDPHDTFPGQGNFDDLWAWDGANWSQLSSSRGPSSRIQVSGAYDTQREELVLFGGDPTGTTYGASDETWSWDGKTWMKHGGHASQASPRVS